LGGTGTGAAGEYERLLGQPDPRNPVPPNPRNPVPPNPRNPDPRNPPLR